MKNLSQQEDADAASLMGFKARKYIFGGKLRIKNCSEEDFS